MLFRHILVPYDGSAQAEEALRHAVRIAEASGGTKLTILNVVLLRTGFSTGSELMFTPVAYNADEELKYCRELLDEAEKLASAVPRLQTIHAFGDPGTVILEQAEELGCDLIVMGSRGRGKLKELVLGSVSHYTVQHARIPVMIVK